MDRRLVDLMGHCGRRGVTRAGAFIAAAAGGFLLSISITPASTVAAGASGETVPPVAADNLRELNNKLARAIAGLQGQSFGAFDKGQVGRTLNDLEVTKFRALDGFPEVFGRPYSESFKSLSCIDEKIAEGKLLLVQVASSVNGGFFGANRLFFRRYVHRLLIHLLEDAKNCKDALEVQLGGASVPTATSDDLRELNNKLARAIAGLQGQSFGAFDKGQVGRTLNDLEVTKFRALDGFPEVFGRPYSESFKSLSCIDEKIAEGKLLLVQVASSVNGGFFGANRLFFRRYVHRLLIHLLEDAKNCKDALEVQLGGSGATPPPPTTTTTPTTTAPKPPPKPTSHAYRGPIDNGVFLASGNGSHIKLTIDSRRVRITFGTDFRYVCQGNQTQHVTGKRTQVNSFDFHPGWAWHPISAMGGFSITLFHHVLAGQFVDPTTVLGTFTFEGVIEASNPTPTECHGNHSWTATLGGKPAAHIGPIQIMIHHVSGPIGRGEATRRDALFQDYLQRQGYIQDASNPNRAQDKSTGKRAVWNRDLETWDDAKTGEHLSGSGNDPAVLAYVFWQLDLFPKGFARTDSYHASNSSTGETAVFDLKKLQWLDAKTGAGLSRAGH